MRFLITRSGIAATAAVALLAIPGRARAQQTDTNPPVPNVLILLDNSGSMERMIDGSVPEDEGNSCNYDPTTGKAIPAAVAPQPNRWGTLLQSLTGSFQNNYNCVSMPRTSGSTFATEYAIDGVKPYDADYYLNYHRPVLLDTSTTPATPCVVSPGSLPGASPGTGVGQTRAGSGANGPGAGQYATDFPPDGIILRPYNALTVTANPTTGACSQFASMQYSQYQYQDGAIPSASTLMRFGLMTFDQDPSSGIGVTGGSNPLVIGPGTNDPLSTAFGAFTGMWTYYPGWDQGAACTYLGSPTGCVLQTLMAVGARNPAAPPWEGRMMRFPATNDLAAQQTNNQNIANVVLATRPYGATPLAGMFADAQYYLWNDPKGPEQADTLVHCGDRPEYIILLTDGAPNLDLQPDCSAPPVSPDPSNPMAMAVGGHCPFPKPEVTAETLNTATGGSVHSVTTFVLGFAVSSVKDGSVNVQCSSLVSNGSLTATCDNTQPTYNHQYDACCELQRIAIAGSKNNTTPTSAYFADTPGDLQKALNAILAQIAAHATTRTTPAFAPSTQSTFADPSTPTTAAQVFQASFNPTPGGPWTGDIVRTRDQCVFGSTSYTVNPVSNAAQGDDFAANLNSHSSARTFIAFQPDVQANGSTVDPTATIRPYVTSTVGDGLGKYSATMLSGPAPNVVPNITAAALGINQPCAYVSSSTHAPVSPGLSTAACATMTLDYTFGQPSFTGNPGDFPFVSRYDTAFGDIYHAAPAIIPAPNTEIQDPSYDGFQAAWINREQIVYAATNDGLLHAFWADETKLENNERWAMLLPAVMPNLYRTYPSSHALLLDGSPVVKDVTWDRTIATSGDPLAWHTMLVSSFGDTNLGYYAVDVTNPDPSGLASGSVPLNPAPTGPPGPNFRWQITSMPSTNYPIFGAHAGTPAITTLFMDPGDGGGQREIGVAILPGGSDPAPTTAASCARATKTSDSAPIGTYAYRTNVRCWGSKLKAADAVNGRSVAIVRIDTGEVLQVFARKADVSLFTSDTLLAANRVRDTALDSPMTGTPLVYPSDVGAAATKIFMADADGTLWKFDVSNPDPTKWTGELYLDLYNQTVDTNSTSWGEGQPLQVTPTVALDPAGEIVINAATGLTDSFDSSGIDFVYSITEKIQGTTPKLRAFVNWYIGSPLTPPTTSSLPPSPQATLTSPALLPGERVSGPMTVFDSKLYFATYAAAPTPPAGQPVTTCSESIARVWSLDFVKPADTNCSDTTSSTCDRSIGGVPMLTLPPPQPASSLVANVTPSATDATLNNVVIPGLAINETPSCASGGSPTTDNYVAGATHTTPSNFTAGSYSVAAQVGQTNPNGPGARMLNNLNVPPPISPTHIDSWAAVLE